MSAISSGTAAPVSRVVIIFKNAAVCESELASEGVRLRGKRRVGDKVSVVPAALGLLCFQPYFRSCVISFIL